MTRVCLIGKPESTLRYELLSRETSREALATYDLERPFENSLAVRTVSVGAAVSLLNDLDWYLTRFVDEALVQEPSVSDEEWLSRSLAEQLRNGDVDPETTAEYCKVYGLVADDPESEAEAAAGPESASGGSARSDSEAASSGADAAGNHDGNRRRPRLVEPLYVRRTDGELPTYDLRDVDETLVVRLTEEEYSP
ncbi:DUF5804 family protein [Halopiger xanaduensis]|uniref:Uncharacterized protein n=1 Tax=Halopiger xanaduensis (strain DSM 18323 / JCM 14033 / SH-6) TaxID=797210 RepID=F8D9R7_HALXS|nr:DUF5804 family protein [Halopiger xanaduensis]AEH37714.1 hypothetical protein Halxa_3100 [Halopiger xanaduensis SH-6]